MIMLSDLLYIFPIKKHVLFVCTLCKRKSSNCMSSISTE